MLPITDSHQASTSKTVENRTSVPSKSRKVFYVKRLSNLQRCSVFYSELTPSEKKIVNGQYKCNICGSSFNAVADLQTHVNNHTTKDPYTCGFCKMPFCELSDLENHVRSHKGKKLFECEITDLLKNLGTWSNLKIESIPEGTKEHEQHFTENLPEFSSDIPGASVDIPGASVFCDDEPFISEVLEEDVEEEQNTGRCISDAVTEEELTEELTDVEEEQNRCTSDVVTEEELTEDSAVIETPAAAVVTAKYKKGGKPAVIAMTKKDLNQTFDESYDLKDAGCVEPLSSSEKTSLQCKTCLRVFPDLKGFTRHHDYHRNMGEYKCHICDKAFHCQAFKQHMKSHSVEASSIEMGQLDLAAEEQGKETGVAAETEEDSSMIFDENQDPGDVDCVEPLSNSELISLQCKTCLRVFPNLKRFMKHYDYHRNMGEYKCDICDKAFHCKAYKEHMKFHSIEALCIETEQQDSHQITGTAESEVKQPPLTHTKERQHMQKHKINYTKCKICGRGYESYSKLLRHCLGHGKPFKCEICESAFSRSESLLVHLKTHGIDKVHKCPDCDLAFDNFASLRQHRKIHAYHTCETCGKSFSRKYFLTDHRKIHGMKSEHRCKTCNKVFESDSCLRRHFVQHFKPSSSQCKDRTHAGDGQHPCSLCGKKFLFRKAMLKHLRIHTGETPDKCRLCGLKFKNWTILKEHFARMHPEEEPRIPGAHIAQNTVKLEKKTYEVKLSTTKCNQDKLFQNYTNVKTKEKPREKNTQILEFSEEDAETCLDEMKTGINSVDTAKARTSGDHRWTRSNLFSGQTQRDNVEIGGYCCGVCFLKFKTREETIAHYSQHEGPDSPMTTQ